MDFKPLFASPITTSKENYRQLKKSLFQNNMYMFSWGCGFGLNILGHRCYMQEHL